MALVESSMFPLGEKAPDFNLPDAVSGNTVTLDQIKSPIATVIMFICNHCPYVQHIAHVLPTLANDYMPKGVAFVAISANDVENFPDDSFENMATFARQKELPFPYLYDESQAVAKAYQAACTPDFYIFNSDLRCVYRGRMDGARPGNAIPVSGNDLRQALDALIADKPPLANQQPSIGCSIKWKETKGDGC